VYRWVLLAVNVLWRQVIGAREQRVKRQLHRGGVGSAQKARQVTRVDRAPVLEIEHAVDRDRHHLVDPVLDHHRRPTGVDVVADRPQQTGGSVRVEVGQRLVDDDHPGPHDQHPGERDQLQLTPGQFIGAGRQQALVDTQSAGHAEDAGQDVASPDTPVLQSEGDVSQHRVADHLPARILQQSSDRLRNLTDGQLFRVLPADGDGAADVGAVGVGHQSVDDAHHGAFATTGWPSEQQQFTRLDAKADIADRRLGRG
jgi:hypothetical protein